MQHWYTGGSEGWTAPKSTRFAAKSWCKIRAGIPLKLWDELNSRGMPGSIEVYNTQADINIGSAFEIIPTAKLWSEQCSQDVTNVSYELISRIKLCELILPEMSDSIQGNWKVCICK